MELLVCIGIIAILAALMLGPISKAKSKAKGVQCMELPPMKFLFADTSDEALAPLEPVFADGHHLPGVGAERLL